MPSRAVVLYKSREVLKGLPEAWRAESGCRARAGWKVIGLEGDWSKLAEGRGSRLRNTLYTCVSDGEMNGPHVFM